MFYDRLFNIKSLKERLLSSTSFAPLHSDQRQPLKKFRQEGISLVPLLAGLLAACGGGGGSTYVPIATGPSTTTRGPGEAGAFRVSVGSSVIEGAAVYVDVNGDGEISAADTLLGRTGPDGVVRDANGAVVNVDEAEGTRLIADLEGAYNIYTGETYGEGETFSAEVDGSGRDIVLSPVTSVLQGLLDESSTRTVEQALDILFPDGEVDGITIEDVHTLANYLPSRGDGTIRKSDPILDAISQAAIDLKLLLDAVRESDSELSELQLISRVVQEILDADDDDDDNNNFDRDDDLVIDLDGDGTPDDLRPEGTRTFNQNRDIANGKPIAVPDLVNPDGVPGIEDVVSTPIRIADWGFRDPGDRPGDPGELASVVIRSISVAGGNNNEGTAVTDADAAMIAGAMFVYTDEDDDEQEVPIANVNDLQLTAEELASARIVLDQDSDYFGTISIDYIVIDEDNQRSDPATLRIEVAARNDVPMDITLTGDRDNSNDDRGDMSTEGRYVVYNGYIRDVDGNAHGILLASDPHYREDITIGNAQDETTSFTLGGRDAAIFEVVWENGVAASAMLADVITLEADNEGEQYNNLRYVVVRSTDEDAELSVSVDGAVITITLAMDGNTAEEVVNAINANGEASALITASVDEADEDTMLDSGAVTSAPVAFTGGAGDVVLRVREDAETEIAGYVYEVSVTVTDSQSGTRTEEFEIVQSGLYIVPDSITDGMGASSAVADDDGQGRAYSAHDDGIVNEEIATPYTAPTEAVAYQWTLSNTGGGLNAGVEFVVTALEAGARPANEQFVLTRDLTSEIATGSSPIVSFRINQQFGFELSLAVGATYEDAVRFLNTADTSTIENMAFRTTLEAYQAIYGTDGAVLYDFDPAAGGRQETPNDLSGSTVVTDVTGQVEVAGADASAGAPDFTPIPIGQLGIEGYDPDATAINTSPITFTKLADDDGVELGDNGLFELSQEGVLTYIGDAEAEDRPSDIGDRDGITNPEDDPETDDVDESATAEARDADTYTINVGVSFTQTFAHTNADGTDLTFTGQRDVQRDGVAAEGEGDIDDATFHYSGGEITNTNLPALAATITLGNSGGSASFSLTATEASAEGNDITYVITQSDDADEVSVSLSGNEISIVLASGRGSEIADIVAALNADEDISALVTAATVSGGTVAVALDAFAEAIREGSLEDGRDEANQITVSGGSLHLDGDRTASGTTIDYDGIEMGDDVFYTQASYIIVSEDVDDEGAPDGTWSAKLVTDLPSGTDFYVLGTLADPVEVTTASYDGASRPAPAAAPPAPATPASFEAYGITFTYDEDGAANNGRFIVVSFLSTLPAGTARIDAATGNELFRIRVGDETTSTDRSPSLADVIAAVNEHSTTNGLGITASLTDPTADPEGVWDRGDSRRGNNEDLTFFGGHDGGGTFAQPYGGGVSADDPSGSLLHFIAGIEFSVRTAGAAGNDITIQIFASSTYSVGDGFEIAGSGTSFIFGIASASHTPPAGVRRATINDVIAEIQAHPELSRLLSVSLREGFNGDDDIYVLPRDPAIVNRHLRFEGGSDDGVGVPLPLGSMPITFTADTEGEAGNLATIIFTSGAAGSGVNVSGLNGQVSVEVATDATIAEVLAAIEAEMGIAITATLNEGADETALFNGGEAFLPEFIILTGGEGDPSIDVDITANTGEAVSADTLTWDRVVENEAHEYVITLRNLDDNQARWLDTDGFTSQGDGTAIDLNERQTGVAQDSTAAGAVLASYSVVDNDGDAVTFTLANNFGGLFTITTREETQNGVTYYVGEVRLATGRAADYEDVQFYDLVIQANTDSELALAEGRTTRPNAQITRELRVNILDVNDQPDRLATQDLSDNILRVPPTPELPEIGIFIGTVTATDQDLLIIPGRTNVDTHSYTISGDDASLFTMIGSALYYTGGAEGLRGAGEEYDISIAVMDSGNGGGVGVGVPARDFTITQSGTYVTVGEGAQADDVYSDGVGILSETATDAAGVRVGVIGSDSEGDVWAIADLADNADYEIREVAVAAEGSNPARTDYVLYYIGTDEPGDADARGDEDEETFGLDETHTPDTNTIRIVNTRTAIAPAIEMAATDTQFNLVLTAIDAGSVFNGVQISFVEGDAFSARLAGEEGDAVAATIVVTVASGTTLADLISAINANALLQQYVTASSADSNEDANPFRIPVQNFALDGGVDGVAGTVDDMGNDMPTDGEGMFTGQKDALIDFDPIIPEEEQTISARAFVEVAGIRFTLDQVGESGNGIAVALSNSLSGSTGFSRIAPGVVGFLYNVASSGMTLADVIAAMNADGSKPSYTRDGVTYTFTASLAEGANGEDPYDTSSGDTRAAFAGGADHYGPERPASVEVAGLVFTLDQAGASGNEISFRLITHSSVIDIIDPVANSGYEFRVQIPAGESNLAGITLRDVLDALNGDSGRPTITASDGTVYTFTVSAPEGADLDVQFGRGGMHSSSAISAKFAGGGDQSVQPRPEETLDTESGTGTFSYTGGEVSSDDYGIDVDGGVLYFSNRPPASFSGIINLVPEEDGFIYVSRDADGGYSAKFGNPDESDETAYVLAYVDHDASTREIIDPTAPVNNSVNIEGLQFAIADDSTLESLSISVTNREFTEEEVAASATPTINVSVENGVLTIEFVGYDLTGLRTATDVATAINADAAFAALDGVTLTAQQGDTFDIAAATEETSEGVSIEPRATTDVNVPVITANDSGEDVTTAEAISYITEEVNYRINLINEDDSAPEFLAVVSEEYGVSEDGREIGATQTIGENTARGVPAPNEEGELVGGGPVLFTVSAFDADDRRDVGTEEAPELERGAVTDDDDELLTSTITYHLDALDDSDLSPDNQYFIINPATGEVRLNADTIPSYEVKAGETASYDTDGNLILVVEVEVRSVHPTEGSTAQVATQRYNVLISDENDAPTDITISRLALVPGGDVVGSLTATDEDSTIIVTYPDGEGGTITREADTHTFALVADTDDNEDEDRAEDNALFSIVQNEAGEFVLTYTGGDAARKSVGEFYRVLLEVTDSAGATFQKAFEFPEGSIAITRDFDGESLPVYSNGRGTIDENSDGSTTATTIGTLSQQDVNGVRPGVTFGLVDGLVYVNAAGAQTILAASASHTAMTAEGASEVLVVNAAGVFSTIAITEEAPTPTIPDGSTMFGTFTNEGGTITFELAATIAAGTWNFDGTTLSINGQGDFVLNGDVLSYEGTNVGDLENRDSHTLVISSTTSEGTSYESYRVNLIGLDENPIIAKNPEPEATDDITEDNGEGAEEILLITEAMFDISGIDISIRAGDAPDNDERLDASTSSPDEDRADDRFTFEVTDTQNGVVEVFDGTNWATATSFTLLQVRNGLVRFNHDSDEQFEKESDSPFPSTTERATQFTVTITDLTNNVSAAATIELDVTPFNDAPRGTNTENAGDDIFVLDGVTLANLEGEEMTFTGYVRNMNGEGITNPATITEEQTFTLPADITSGDTVWVWWPATTDGTGDDYAAVKLRFIEVGGNVEVTVIRATQGTTTTPTAAFFEGQTESSRLVDTLGLVPELSNVGVNIMDITINDVEYENFVRISYSVNEQDSDSANTDEGGADDYQIDEDWIFPAWDIDNARGDVTITIVDETSVGQIVRKEGTESTILNAGDSFTAQEIADGEIYYRHNGGEGIEQGDRTGEVAPTRARDGRDTFTYTIDDGANDERSDDYTPPVFTLTLDILPVNDRPTAFPETDTEHDNYDAYTIGDRIVQDDNRPVFNANRGVTDEGQAIFLEGGFNDNHYVLSLADVGVYDPDHLVISRNGATSEITYTFKGATGTDTDGNTVNLMQANAATGTTGIIVVEQRQADGSFAEIAVGATFSLTEIANGNIRLRHNGESQVNAQGQAEYASFGLVYSATDADGAESEDVVLNIQVREINDLPNNLRVVALSTGGDTLADTESVTRIGTDVAADARIAFFFTEDEETTDQTDGFDYVLVDDDVNHPDNQYFELVDQNSGDGHGRVLKFKSAAELEMLGLRLKNEGQNYEITVRVTDSSVGNLDGQGRQTEEFTLSIPVRDFDVDWDITAADLQTAEERPSIDMLTPPRQRFDLDPDVTPAVSDSNRFVIGIVELSGIDGAVYSIERVVTSADDFANVRWEAVSGQPGQFRIYIDSINRNNELLRDLQDGQELDVEFFLELRADPINTENEPGVVYGFRRTTESFVVRFIGTNDAPLSDPEDVFVDQLERDAEGNPTQDTASGEWSFQASDVTPNSDRIAENGLYFVLGTETGAPPAGSQLVGLNVFSGSTSFDGEATRDIEGLYGTLEVRADGTWEYVSTAADNDAAPAGLTTETFTYWVADNAGSISEPRTITITIDGQNDAPVFFVNTDVDTAITASNNVGIAPDAIAENPASLTPDTSGGTSPASLTATAGQMTSGRFRVVDADNGAQVRLFIGDVEVGELTDGGTLTFEARYGDLVFTITSRSVTPSGSVTFEGTWTYTANERAERIAAGEAPLESLEVNIRDEYSARSVTINIDIIINGANDAPTYLGQVADSGGTAVEVAADNGRDNLNGNRDTEEDGRPIRIEDARLQVREIGFRTDGNTRDYVIGYNAGDGTFADQNPYQSQTLGGLFSDQQAYEYRANAQNFLYLERTIDNLGAGPDWFNREEAVRDGTLTGNGGSGPHATHLANGIFDAFDIDNFGEDGRRSAIDLHTYEILGAGGRTTVDTTNVADNANDNAVIATGDRTINPRDHDGTAGTYVTSYTGIYGTLTVDFYTGEWFYILNNQDRDTAELRDGQMENDVFTIQVTDEEGAIYRQDITIRVTGSEDDPILFVNNIPAGMTVGTGTDGGELSGPTLAHDWDATAYQRVSRTNGQTPNLRVAERERSLAPNDPLGLGRTTTAQISFIVRDPDNNDAIGSGLEYRISSPNGNFQRDVIDAATGLNGARSMTSTDAVTGDTATLNLQYGSAQIGDDGVLLYTIGQDFFANYQLDDGDIVYETIIVQVDDNTGDSNRVTVTFRITGVNDAPFLNAQASTGTTITNGAVSFSATEADSISDSSGSFRLFDLDAGDGSSGLGVAILGSNSGSAAGSSIAANGMTDYITQAVAPNQVADSIAANELPAGYNRPSFGTFTFMRSSTDVTFNADSTATGAIPVGYDTLSWTYDYDETAINTLGHGETITETIYIRVNDDGDEDGQNEAFIVRQLSVTITGAEDAPVIGFADTAGAEVNVGPRAGANTEDATTGSTHSTTFSHSDVDRDDLGFADVDSTNPQTLFARILSDATTTSTWTITAADATRDASTNTGNAASVVGEYGTLYFSADGEAQYVVDENNGEVIGLSWGETLYEVIQFRLDDDDGTNVESNVITRIITIQGALEDTIAVPEGTASRTINIREGESIDEALADVSRFFTKPSNANGDFSDVNDELAYLITPNGGTPLPRGLSLTGAAATGGDAMTAGALRNARLTGTVSYNAIPANNLSGMSTFTVNLEVYSNSFTAATHGANTVTIPLTFVVTNVNRAPVTIGEDIVYFGNLAAGQQSDSNAQIDLSQHFFDADAGNDNGRDTLTYTITSSAGASNVNVFNQDESGFTTNTLNFDLDAARADDAAIYTITATDAGGATASKDFIFYTQEVQTGNVVVEQRGVIDDVAVEVAAGQEHRISLGDIYDGVAYLDFTITGPGASGTNQFVRIDTDLQQIIIEPGATQAVGSNTYLLTATPKAASGVAGVSSIEQADVTNIIASYATVRGQGLDFTAKIAGEAGNNINFRYNFGATGDLVNTITKANTQADLDAGVEFVINVARESITWQDLRDLINSDPIASQYVEASVSSIVTPSNPIAGGRGGQTLTNNISDHTLSGGDVLERGDIPASSATPNGALDINGIRFISDNGQALTVGIRGVPSLEVAAVVDSRTGGGVNLRILHDASDPSTRAEIAAAINEDASPGGITASVVPGYAGDEPPTRDANTFPTGDSSLFFTIPASGATGVSVGTDTPSTTVSIFNTATINGIVFYQIEDHDDDISVVVGSGALSASFANNRLSVNAQSGTTRQQVIDAVNADNNSPIFAKLENAGADTAWGATSGTYDVEVPDEETFTNTGSIGGIDFEVGKGSASFTIIVDGLLAANAAPEVLTDYTITLPEPRVMGETVTSTTLPSAFDFAIRIGTGTTNAQVRAAIEGLADVTSATLGSGTTGSAAFSASGASNTITVTRQPPPIVTPTFSEERSDVNGRGTASSLTSGSTTYTSLLDFTQTDINGLNGVARGATAFVHITRASNAADNTAYTIRITDTATAISGVESIFLGTFTVAAADSTAAPAAIVVTSLDTTISFSGTLYSHAGGVYVQMGTSFVVIDSDGVEGTMTTTQDPEPYTITTYSTSATADTVDTEDTTDAFELIPESDAPDGRFTIEVTAAEASIEITGGFATTATNEGEYTTETNIGAAFTNNNGASVQWILSGDGRFQIAQSDDVTHTGTTAQIAIAPGANFDTEAGETEFSLTLTAIADGEVPVSREITVTLNPQDDASPVLIDPISDILRGAGNVGLNLADHFDDPDTTGALTYVFQHSDELSSSVSGDMVTFSAGTGFVDNQPYVVSVTVTDGRPDSESVTEEFIVQFEVV